MQDYAAFWAEWKLSSGETMALDDSQNQFNRWIGSSALSPESVMIPEETTWVFEPDFDDNEDIMQDFFIYINEKIANVPVYKYLLRYLLIRFQISISENNYEGLWRHVEDPKWRVSTGKGQEELRDSLKRKLSRENGEEAGPLTDEDFKDVITVLCNRLKACYSSAGYTGSWTTYFRNLIMDLNVERLRKLALALEWDWETYHLFKAKVLKVRALNLMDRDDVLIYLALKYAHECDKTVSEAYLWLSAHYPEPDPVKKVSSKRKQEQRKQEQPDKAAAQAGPHSGTEEMSKDSSSVSIGDLLENTLESDSGLNPDLRNRLLTEVIPEIQEAIQTIQEMNSRKVMRSPQAVFLEEWDKFQENVRVRDILLGFEEPSRHDIFRWLYGSGVEKQVSGKKTNRILDLPDSQMIALAPDGSKDFFLDSKEFLDTRIRDNDFYAATFTNNEVRQRNLLLTMAFLNYVVTGENSLPYELRIADFSFNTTDLMNKCGFMSLHSANAYDSFLKLLLSCDDPLSLFQFIWSRKTGSYKHG